MSYKCYACTLCERTCPVDASNWNTVPNSRSSPSTIEAARAAALTTLPGESCGAASACVMGEQPAAFLAPVDMKLLDPVIAGIRSGSGLIEAMHATQEAYGYLPRLALEAIAEEMHLDFSRVYGVASFYSQFRLKPVGKYVIDVCMGTACHVAGAPLVLEAFSQELEIPVGDTTRRRSLHPADGQLRGRLRAGPGGPPRRRRDVRPHGPERGPTAGTQAAQTGGGSMTRPTPS